MFVSINQTELTTKLNSLNQTSYKNVTQEQIDYHYTIWIEFLKSCPPYLVLQFVKNVELPCAAKIFALEMLSKNTRLSYELNVEEYN